LYHFANFAIINELLIIEDRRLHASGLASGWGGSVPEVNAQHRATNGEGTHVRTAFDYLRTVEEYKCAIFFFTPSRRTIVDSLRISFYHTRV